MYTLEGKDEADDDGNGNRRSSLAIITLCCEENLGALQVRGRDGPRGEVDVSVYK